MEKHLYIIGNGFDLHHDIPSKYYDKKGGDCFRKWLEENDCETLCEIDDNFGSTGESWWSRFEESLADVDTLRVACEEAFAHYPKFGSDDFHDRDWYEAELSAERRLDKVYSDIVVAFRKWINQLPSGNPIKKLRINVPNSQFLSFNYTNTLETLYNVSTSNILYIHGKANSNDELIVGHGLDYRSLKKKFEELERNESGDYVYQQAKDASLYSVANHRKKVEGLIEDNKVWFDRLCDVTQIHIYGHSINNIDLPYYHKVFDVIDRQKVIVEMSYLTGNDYNNNESIMRSQGFPRGQYKQIKLRDIQISCLT